MYVIIKNLYTKEGIFMNNCMNELYNTQMSILVLVVELKHLRFTIIILKLLKMFLFILNLLILFMINVDMNVNVVTRTFMKIIL